MLYGTGTSESGVRVRAVQSWRGAFRKFLKRVAMCGGRLQFLFLFFFLLIGPRARWHLWRGRLTGGGGEILYQVR